MTDSLVASDLRRVDPKAACAPPLRIFVAGSCVSRDAFGEPQAGDALVLTSYLARSSLATLACAPASPTPNIAKIASLFQRRMVKADHARQLLALARAGEFDLLLLDLIDERFHLLRREDGAIVTYSNEYAAVAGRPLGGTWIRSGSAEHVHMWRVGLQRLIEALDESGSLAKVRINCVYWAARDVDGKPTHGFSPEVTEAANAFLAERYRDLEAAFGESACLRYPPSALVSDPHHRWGVSAFHYVPALYEETRRRLIESMTSHSSVPQASQLTGSCPTGAAIAPRTRQVELAVSDCGLTASIKGPNAPELEYAFYLMRGPQRVAATWYSPRTTVTLPYPSIPGTYEITAFERQRRAPKPTRKYRTLPVQLPDPACYAAQRWSDHIELYDRDRSLLAVDGVHRVLDDGPSSLDFLLRGFTPGLTRKPLLVCFGGAIVHRRGMAGPFFHGLSLGRACGLPVVCVADPTLTRSADVALAWYAGNDQWPTLYREIARHLDQLAEATKSSLVLVGGSGGGFAALSVLIGLNSVARAIVWNPQTTIARYHPLSVQRYVMCAFPEIARKMGLGRRSADHASREMLAECMERAGVLHDLTRVMPISRAKALYLQNESDTHHIEGHLKPFLASRGLSLEAGQHVMSSDGLTVCLGNWGSGHARPSPQAVAWLVNQVALGRDNEAVARSIVDGEMPQGHQTTATV
ncbi:MAG: hypothetical protein J0H28_07040 [Methylibium petroleiphilum]|nr:hypothetical protein [Methylibium petroleiphilum]